MHYLTTSEHRRVVERLLSLMKFDGVNPHAAGFAYTSLMVCFMMHCRASGQSLVTLHEKSGDEWFPATTGYVIVRSLFEVDVLAHYIARDPAARSQRYIDYGHVLDKQMLDAVVRHQRSSNLSWAEGLQLTYNNDYKARAAKIDADFARVSPQFRDSDGRSQRSWSGKSIRQMAKEVDHLEAYDVFYADLSSFTHVSVNLANRFLRLEPSEVRWSQRANEYDVANVFRYAATFLTCLAQHFGREFGTWSDTAVDACWSFPEADARKREIEARQSGRSD